MNKENFSRPINLKQIQITDEFWHREQELVRREVIPYQWEALNDRIPEAAPSYCMRNFKVAGRMMREKKEKGAAYIPPAYTFRGFEALPEDPANPDPDKFYGFVFQDSDFSKWIEAVGYSLTQHPDRELEKTADEAIDIVCAAQMENGYLDTYYIINGMDRAFTNLKDHHELYCFGHLTEGAVAYYQATGKDKLLNAAKKYADYIISRFGLEDGKCKGYPGHEIAEMALVRLYEVTGEERYLELSRFFLEERGTAPYYFDKEEEERASYENRPYRQNQDNMRYAYYQAHKPVREQDEAVGHAVRAVYLYSGMADVARLTGDEAMLAACERLWNSIVREKLYITGGIGGTHMGEAFSFPYDLPNDTAYSETCAAIGLVFFARRMLELHADSKYADVMENALYNTVLSGMALDGKSFFYVNPLEVLPEACHKDARKFHVKPIRQKWFGCACCPPNIARLVSSVPAYAYTENERTLWTHLYMGSCLNKQVGDKTLDIKMETGFPWNGGAGVTLHCEENISCTLAYRIPGWSGKGSAKVMHGGTVKEIFWEKADCSGERAMRVMNHDEDVSGEAGDANSGKLFEKAEISNEKNMTGQAVIKNGYLYLTCDWQDGDSIQLDFSMEVRVMEADTRVREDIGKVAFTRGPIVYCMEEADNGAELHLNCVDMDAVFGKEPEKDNASSTSGGIVIEDWEGLGHRMCILKVPGRREEPSTGNALYQEYCRSEEKPVTLTFVPYYAWNNRGEGEMSVWVRK